MKQAIIIITFLLLVLWSCNKGIEADNQYLRGRLFLLDTITQSSNGIPIANRKVLLTIPGDSLNYLYSTKTDADGYFSFTLLADGQNEFILRTFDSTKGYIYQSRKEVKRGQTNIVLVEQLDETLQNGFVLKTTDESGNSLQGTKVYFYKTLSLAVQNSPAGAVDSFISIKDGKLYKLRVTPGLYYVNALKTIDTATFQRSLKQIIIPSTGFLYDSIQLNRKITNYRNGFTLVVMDSLGGFVPNASVYLYNSQVLAASNSPSGVFESFPTDNLGKKTRYDLPAGDYYINVSKVLSDTIVYHSLVNKLVLPSSGFINDTIIVKRKR